MVPLYQNHRQNGGISPQYYLERSKKYLVTRHRSNVMLWLLLFFAFYTVVTPCAQAANPPAPQLPIITPPSITSTPPQSPAPQLPIITPPSITSTPVPPATSQAPIVTPPTTLMTPASKTSATQSMVADHPTSTATPPAPQIPITAVPATSSSPSKMELPPAPPPPTPPTIPKKTSNNEENNKSDSLSPSKDSKATTKIPTGTKNKVEPIDTRNFTFAVENTEVEEAEADTILDMGTLLPETPEEEMNRLTRERAEQHKKDVEIIEKRAHLNYRTATVPNTIYMDHYNKDNQHLPKPQTLSEYQDMMMQAMDRNDIATVRTFITNAPLIENKDDKGNTPLMIAIRKKNPNMVTLLLANHADVMTSNTMNATPLHVASYTGQADITSSLLALGSPVNKQDAEGNTPLMLAAMYGKKEIAEQLIEHQANKALRNKNGKTASDIATDTGNLQLAEFLKEPIVHVDYSTIKSKDLTPHKEKVMKKAKKRVKKKSVKKHVKKTTKTHKKPIKKKAIEANQ